MNTNEILEAIDLQIVQLQKARELLADVTADVPVAGTTQQSSGKRRGRPRGSVNKKPEAIAIVAKKKGRAPLSAEARARIAVAQQARWAAQKKASLPAKSVVKKITPKSSKKTVPATKKPVAVKRVPRAESSPASATEA